MALPKTREIELAGLKAWPGIEVAFDGAWVRRAAGGYTKRANSVQCLDPADGQNAAERIIASRRWLEDRGLPPVFRITPLAAPGLVAALAEAGWVSFEQSRVLVMGLDGRTIEADPRVELLEADDPTWLRAQQELQGYSDATAQWLAAVISAIEVPGRGILLRNADGRPLASALMGVADRIVFAVNVVTAVSDRGCGHGTAVMRAGLAWGASAGAEFAAIQVVASNTPALALYRKLGYAHAYDYHYLRPAA